MAGPRAILAVLACAASASSALGFMQPFSVAQIRPLGAGMRSVASASSGPRIPLGARGRGPAGVLGLRSELLSNFKTAVRELKQVQDFHDLKEASRLVILKLGSSHCRKCFAMQPKYAQVAEQYQEDEAVEFAMVHLDKVRGMVQETGVKKTPTFHVYKDGEKVDELIGSGDVSSVAAKVRGLVEQWRAEVAEKKAAGAHDVMLKQIVESYSPAGEEVSPLSESVSVSDRDADAVSGEECGENGCEIAWD